VGVTHVTERPFSCRKYTPGCVDGSIAGPSGRDRVVAFRGAQPEARRRGDWTTIRYADCVLLERPAEDEIVLWDRDGDRIYIPGDFWRGGRELIAEIAAARPADIVIEDRISLDLID